MDITTLIERVYGTMPEPLQEPVQAVMEVGGGVIPIISSALHYLKHKKIDKELRKVHGQIELILDKLEASQNSKLFKQDVFPIVLNKIINEEQPEKISVILNGFEYIIDNNMIELDKIFHYYDVLEEMRLSEIFHLAEKYVKPMEMVKSPGKYELKLNIKLEYTEEDREQEDLERYMDNKLFRLGILKFVKELVDEPSYLDYSQSSLPYQWQPPEPKKFEINTDKYELSRFGLRFIKFFYEEDNDE